MCVCVCVCMYIKQKQNKKSSEFSRGMSHSSGQVHSETEFLELKVNEMALIGCRPFGMAIKLAKQQTTNINKQLLHFLTRFDYNQTRIIRVRWILLP